jgi:hypothetical protein
MQLYFLLSNKISGLKTAEEVTDFMKVKGGN